MSCLNDKTFSDILEFLESDLFNKYKTELVEETTMLYNELIKHGKSHENALTASLQGSTILSFKHSVKLCLLITCLGNSTDDHEKVIDFLRNNVKMYDDTEIKSLLTVIKGGKE